MSDTEVLKEEVSNAKGSETVSQEIKTTSNDSLDTSSGDVVRRLKKPSRDRKRDDDFSSRNEKESKARLKSVYTAKAAKPAWLDEETFKKEEKKHVPESVKDTSYTNRQQSSNSDGFIKRNRNEEDDDAKKYKRPTRRTHRRVENNERGESTMGQNPAASDGIQKFESNDEAVRAFYNERVHIARKQIRVLSPIIKMRNFNNAIKYMLIGMFAKRGDKVLDMGCGKGGDLNKWAMADVQQYIGIDISDASILEAIKRYRNLRDKQFPAIFATGDCFGMQIPSILQNFKSQIQFPVDIVSMQFCMHYAFESEEKARNMLNNVSQSLRRGGTFIGTIPSSDFIKQKIAGFVNDDDKSFGNSIYSVTFEKTPPKDGVFRPAFGHKYTYYLEDAVDNVPEYVVPFESFRAIAEEYNLDLKYKKTFAELFAEEIPEWHHKLNRRLLDGMKRTDGSYGVEGEEAEASAFYIAFAFEKTGYD